MKRLLTGIVYVAILIAFYALRVYLHEPLIFDLLILTFSVLGTREVCRALGDRTDAIQRAVVQIFSAGMIACYCVSDSVFRYLAAEGREVTNYSTNLAFIFFMTGAAILMSLLVFRHEKTSLQSTGYAFLSYLYPSVFLLVVAGVNHMPVYSQIGILFVFAICPFSDCFAYLFGKLLGKKLPMKMAPHVSPNKTVIGGAGGLLGGAVGAVAIFFAYYLLVQPAAFSAKWTNLVFFIMLGVLTSAFAELGDLVESAVKRKIGIKDMGKILPGHGGIMDRIDSTLYACLIVCFVLVIRLMTTG